MAKPARTRTRSQRAGRWQRAWERRRLRPLRCRPPRIPARRSAGSACSSGIRGPGDNGTRSEIGDEAEIELGWTLERAAWGHGFATEGAIAVRDWTVREVQPRRLISLIHPDNARSIRVAEKIGERYEHDVVIHHGAHGAALGVTLAPVKHATDYLTFETPNRRDYINITAARRSVRARVGDPARALPRQPDAHHCRRVRERRRGRA